jgi:SAM-dependent methyltransferase
MEQATSREQAKNYYEDFSLAVGLRDWLRPNRRHEALRMRIDRLLSGRKGLRILDIGCGAGVMTAHLRRYGDVTGIDFSSAAIAAARDFVPGVDFKVASLEDLPADQTFDVLTLFDVLEHIPEDQRRDFFAGCRQRLNDGGLMFASTPFPDFTRQRKERDDPTLQIIDEEVELPDVLQEAAAAGLQLVSFEAFDVFKGSPEYQSMVFAPTGEPGGTIQLAPAGLDKRMRVKSNRWFMRAGRVTSAARLLTRGRFKAAWFFLRGRPPEIKS